MEFIFNNTVYKIEFLNDSKEEIISLNMTFDDLKNAFLENEDQKDFF